MECTNCETRYRVEGAGKTYKNKWFCGWCVEYIGDEILQSRAEQNENQSLDLRYKYN